MHRLPTFNWAGESSYSRVGFYDRNSAPLVAQAYMLIYAAPSNWCLLTANPSSESFIVAPCPTRVSARLLPRVRCLSLGLDDIGKLDALVIEYRKALPSSALMLRFRKAEFG